MNLALYKRALLTDGRRFVFYGSWLLMGILLWISLYSINQTFGSSGGLSFLSTVAYFNYYFIVLAGIFGFSSAITEEKEEETMGLLIMTGISPLTFIVSKAGARFTRGMLLIISQIPFTMMAVTLGGVSINQVIAVYLVLISYMFFLCMMCTFISLLSSTNRMSTTISFLVLILGVLLLKFMTEIGLISADSEILFIHSQALHEVLTTAFEGYIVPKQFYAALIGGGIFFLLALWKFNQFALRKPLQEKSKKRTNKKHAWSNALAWKEYYFQFHGYKSWITLAVIYAVALLIVYMNFYMMQEEVFMTTLFVTSCVLIGLQLTHIVSVMFSGEFKEGTHSSIFTLPIDNSEIFIQKLLGGMVYMLPSLVIGFFTWFYILNKTGPGEFEAYVIIISTLFLYLALTAYFSLILRIGGFIAAGAIVFIGYFLLALILFRSLGSSEAITFMIVVINIGIGTVMIARTNSKVTELKSR